MRIVAILARCRILMSGLQRQTMHAGGITVGLPFMTDRTIHRFQHDIIVGMLCRDIRMAADAGIRPVR